MANAASRSSCGNRLLGGLSDADFDALALSLQLVHLNQRDVIAERGAHTDYVYFPCTAVLSVLSFMEGGAAVEVGTIGKEGFFGIEVLLGNTEWSQNTICQVEGDSLRMSASAFRSATADDSALRRVLQHYLAAYLALVSQSVACNRLHSIEERFARWVLMTQDRVGSDAFFLTQDFIADMLGVHRPSVSLVAGAFQQAGFIRYSRGWMHILNRAGLEEASCECYATNTKQFDALAGAG